MAASNVALSRGLPTLPITRTTLATIRGGAPARVKTSPSLPSSSLFYSRPKSLVARRSSAIRCSVTAEPTTTPTTIARGDRLPDATLSFVDDDGKLRRTTTVAELTAGKNVVLLALGSIVERDNIAFAEKFAETVKERRGWGADTVACVAWLPEEALEKRYSDNDSGKEEARLELWKYLRNVVEKEGGVDLLVENNGEFTEALGESEWPLKVGAVDGVVRTAEGFCVALPIKQGQCLPNATLTYVEHEDELRRTVTVAELTEGKDVMLLITGDPLDQVNAYLAQEFVEIADKLQGWNADVVACIGLLPESSPVPDEWKMWRVHVGDEDSRVILLADRTGSFVNALGNRPLPQRPLRVSLVKGRVNMVEGFYPANIPKVPLGESLTEISPPFVSFWPGDRLPDATLSYVDDDGKLRRTTTVAEFTAGKKVTLLAVDDGLQFDNIFLIQGFVDKAEKLRGLGADTVAVVARLPVENSLLLKSWHRHFGRRGNGVVMLADNGEFLKAFGNPPWPLQIDVDDGVVLKTGDFDLKPPGGDSFYGQALKIMNKFNGMLENINSIDIDETSPEPADEMEIPSDRIIDDEFIDGSSGKEHIEDLMKEQVMQDYINKLNELNRKFQKEVEGDLSMFSTLESLMKEFADEFADELD